MGPLTILLTIAMVCLVIGTAWDRARFGCIIAGLALVAVALAVVLVR